ncbi:DNA-binding transcriptional regulator, GntR family [Pseudosulfitobacter pseudonitzschiae]|uniref:GntR family transcriptional regulator n=1 Tax=Pseudosulfitobacter pseudonitzschiae TaxID=1402135 RepID=A0A073IYQ0_9RHOB|nr:GntR family transcriptional regulator [Pseudosulfitobacter pseudonitzschiae]KEJ94874.1 GntR family transcriptional regulator [Pseudosulfitobacter pseudonitzschiae]QKS07352.1 GntR family transcriptional regulator [Pseudosulfitobacter pseudonitzschiae]SHF95696.1 DNA-binding transcriptional regulator, GntR family [Pseudosulfitobacter pseudonitzschiae]
MKADRTTAVTLDASAPIAPQIYAQLRDAIIRNRFAPGDRISESEIAKTCDVSRQPVREAFIRLAGEGLLAILPQRGTIITKINYTDVLNARFLREAIEADIVAILAANPDPALIRELRAQLTAQQAVARDKPSDFIELDERFHRTMADGAGKRGAWRRIEGLKSQMDRVRFLSLGHFPAEKLVTQHKAVVDNIENGKMIAANAAIRGHLREVLGDLPRILTANPEFFELPEGGIPTPVNAPIQGGDLQ